MSEEEEVRLIKKYEGKKILICTNAKLKYKTQNLKVLGDRVIFNDKFGNEVLLSISEIVSIVEVFGNGQT